MIINTNDSSHGPLGKHREKIVFNNDSKDDN